MTIPTTLPHLSRRTNCRLCDSDQVKVAFLLTPTPPANAFVPAELLGVSQATYPLDVYFCENCTHVQLLDVVDPSVLFSNYVYVSGTSPSFVRHFEFYADDVARLTGSLRDVLVLDIGSNDGTLLRAFEERHGARVLGVDPARNIAAAATAAGIETIADFFTPALAAKLAAERGHASVVTANNVFAHVDDLAGLVESIRAVLAKDGVFVFEVSYLLDVVEKTLFDTVYHEHLAYHAVRPLIPFFKRHGLELIEALRVPTHGGSLRGIVQHAGGPRPCGASVAQALEAEAQRGLDRIDTYLEFGTHINQLREELSSLLRRLKSQGKTIAGFGAPAKATTLMYHFAIGPEQIDFIVDDSPLKQGLFTPGMHIPVETAQAIKERKPDYLLVLAWNFAEAIIAKNKEFLHGGGRFIVPLPKIEVVER
jgi:SAM-dependent methyltransferase